VLLSLSQLLLVRESLALVSQTEGRFRDMVALLSDAYWHEDAEGLRLTMSQPLPAGNKVVEGLTFVELMANACDADSMSRLSAALASQKPFRALRLLGQVSPAGKSFELACSGEPLRNVSGELVGWHGTTSDVTHAVALVDAERLTALNHSQQALATAHGTLLDARSALADAQAGEREARDAALHDGPTGLPNREHFNARLTQDIGLARRHSFGLAVMFFDLNKFKAINDTFGHAAGDEVLRQVAARLVKHCRVEDSVCRTGGDEFLYALVDPKGRGNVERIAAALVDALSAPVSFEGRQLSISPSIGIAMYPEHGLTATQLVGNADTAMFVAKKATDGPGWALYEAPASLPEA
jgi:diguanylate cyclase